ncbi:MAG: HNH endonuclease signature motif containing protein [Gordonia sp. (in: high G+C Gram-positive bacteria)]
MSTRNTAIRDRHRRQIARNQPPCGICGQPIDYNITNHLDPMAYVVDHIVPISAGGSDTLDNKQAGHRACNRAKSDKTPTGNGAALRVFETARTW